MDIITELDRIINEVNSNKIDSLKDLYLELIDLKHKIIATNEL